MKKLLIVWLALFLMTASVFAQEREQSRDQVQLREHLIMKEGRVVQVRDQERMQLREALRLQNGTLVNPDGTYQLRNGKQLRLRDGECLDMAGKRYRNEKRFLTRMENRNRQHLNKAERGKQQMRPGNRPERNRRN